MSTEDIKDINGSTSSPRTAGNDYLTNAQGHLVPKALVKPLDALRDDMVGKIMMTALDVQTEMLNAKKSILDDIEAFMALASEQYGAKIGGEKGNLTLSSYDGKYKVLLANDTGVVLDERLHIAKKLIDNCIHRWTAGSSDNLKALVEHAFRTDKAGNINTARVLSLLQLDIKDEEWIKAMEALKESIQPNKSKRYLRLYQRVDDNGRYEQIGLDMAGM